MKPPDPTVLIREAFQRKLPQQPEAQGLIRLSGISGECARKIYLSLIHI